MPCTLNPLPKPSDNMTYKKFSCLQGKTSYANEQLCCEYNVIIRIRFMDSDRRVRSEFARHAEGDTDECDDIGLYGKQCESGSGI